MKRFLLLSFALLLSTASLVQAQQVPVTTDSDAARTHFEKGRLAASHIQFEKARTHLDAALKADPDFALAHLYRASLSPAEERAAHMKQAKANANDASEGEQMMIEAYAARMSEDDDRELELLKKVAERYSDDPHAPFLMGWRYYGQERYDEARAAAEQALEADSAFAPAYNMLGYIALEQEDYARSEEAFKSYVRLAPDEANPYDSLGELYLNMERYDEATAQFEKALARDPNFTVSRDNLARAGIEQVNLKFEKAIEQQDVEALTALYTSSGSLAPPNHEVVRGQDAIREYWAGVFGAGIDGVDLVTNEVYSMNNVAVELGEVEVRVGDQVVDEAKYSVVWRKDGDTWKLHRDIWNSNRPSPAPTAAAIDE